MFNYAVKVAVAILFFCASTITNVCAQRPADMGWQQDLVTIDGRSAEWTFPLPLYDPKTKLNFGFSNDDKRMYFVFVANTEMARYKILSSGFSLSIDIDGDKKYETDLLFQPNVVAFQNGGSAYTKSIDTSHKKPSWTIPVYITSKGLKNVPDGHFGNGGNHGIDVAMIPNDDFARMFCELSIPFSLFYKDSLRDVGTENVFNVKITINKIESSGNNLMSSGGISGGITSGTYNGAGSGAYGGMGNGAGGYGGGGSFPNSGNGYPGGNGVPNYPSNNDQDVSPATNGGSADPELNIKRSIVLKLKPSTPPTK